jgi:hypothetical protein
MPIGFHLLDLIFLLFFCGVFVIGILGTLFWIWMLIDCATQEPSEGNDKVIWILVIIFTHFIGALMYYFIRRPERKRLQYPPQIKQEHDQPQTQSPTEKEMPPQQQ